MEKGGENLMKSHISGQAATQDSKWRRPRGES